MLIAILAPSLDKAIEQAQRAQCASNLHVFGTGLGQYALDNRRRYLTTPMHFNHVAPYPMAPYVYNNIHPGDWSLEALDPYVGGFDPTGTRGVYGPYRCPANPAHLDAMYTAEVQAGRGKPLPIDGHDGAWINTEYALYAGVDQWNSGAAQYASEPQQLATSKMGSPGLLMADTIYDWSGNGGYWIYNHGEYHVTGEPAISGVNQLYGDGGVRWSDFSIARNRAMDRSSPDRGSPVAGQYVSSNGIVTGDLNWY